MKKLNNMKKLFLLLLCVVCSLQMSAQFSGSGSGTSSDPYLIFNPNQLNQIRNFLNTSGVYFKLMDDIDLKDWIADNNPTQGWQPTGISSSPFKGVLEGNGHKITNFTVSRSSTDYVGFFGCTDGATISNLEIDGTVNGKGYTGGLIGSCTSSTVSSCSFNGDVTGGERTGGMFGFVTSSTITNCSTDGSVTSSNQYIGGLIGYEDSGSSLSGCSVQGNVTGIDNIGGFCGYVASSITCDKCYTKNDKVLGANNVGGFIGMSGSSTTLSTTLTRSGSISNVVGTLDNIGGFVGKIEGEGIKIDNCFSVGDIDSDGNYVGGFVGYIYITSISDGNISNSYHIGKIYGNNYIGGLFGKLLGYLYYHINIQKCYSKSSIRGNQYVGGIVGNCSDAATLKSNVSANDEINATKGNVGRIYGTIGTSGITIGANGSSAENKGLVTTKLISNGITLTPDDDLQNGTSVGLATLKLKATYMGIGWDFTNNWSIQETECFPYKLEQTAPPVIQSNPVSGATTINGKSVDGGTVEVTVGGKTYTAVSSSNQWMVTTDALQAGDLISVCAKADGKQQSYYATQYVGFSGKGTKAEPYLVFTAADLQGINSMSYYKLMNDVDLTSWISKNSPTTGWIPVGREHAVMKYFDGNGHKITGLWTNTTDNYTGLFANSSNDTIANVTVVVAEGKSVKGGDYTGILIGKNQNGTILNCTITGDVSGTGHVGGVAGYSSNDSIVKCIVKGDVTSSGSTAGFVGGVAGYSNSIIKNSAYIGNLSAADENTNAGGIAGYSEKEISLSYTTGNVSATGKSSIAGGLVGTSKANISNCYSTSAVKSTNYAAGIAGYSFGDISKCYSAGDIKCDSVGAGVVGYNDNTGATTSYCLAANNIIDVAKAKGIATRVIGGYRNNAPDPKKNNYALKTMAVSVNNVPQIIYDDLLNGIAKTADETKLKATYELLGWDLTNVWDINSGIAYPYLRSNAAVPDTTSHGGGTGQDTTVVHKDIYNTFAINDTTGNAGVQIKLPILMNNRDSITAFQMDLYLPNGVSVAKDADDEYMISWSDRTTANKHMLSYAKQSDGAMRIIGLSMTNAVFKGNSGPLLYVTLNVADTIADGDYTVMIKNMKLSTPKAVEYDVDETKAKLTLSSYRLGDVDNNGSITISDAVAIVNYLLGNPGTPFIFKAADLDKNSSITINDAVLLVKALLGQVSLAKSSSAIKATANSNTADMEVLPFSINAGEEKTINVLLNNTEDNVTAFQFDVNLPEGLTSESCEKADGRLSESHTLFSSHLANNDMRIVCLSMTNASVNGTSGAVASIKVKASDNLASGIYYLTLSNIHIAHPSGLNEMTPSDSKSAIYAGGTTNIGSVATDGLIISTGKGMISVTSNAEQCVKILSIDGKLVDNYTLSAGENRTTHVASGLYLVNNKKVVVR